MRGGTEIFQLGDLGKKGRGKAAEGNFCASVFTVRSRVLIHLTLANRVHRREGKKTKKAALGVRCPAVGSWRGKNGSRVIVRGRRGRERRKEK